MDPMETPYVVLVTANFLDEGWQSVTEFYFDTLDEAFHFFDNDAEKLVQEAYARLHVSEFEVSIWDDTYDTEEALEVMTIANKE